MLYVMQAINIGNIKREYYFTRKYQNLKRIKNEKFIQSKTKASFMAHVNFVNKA